MRLTAVVHMILILALAGCSSIVRITSDPTGARVTIDGQERGETPLLVKVEWNSMHYNWISLSHPNCHTLTTVMRRTFGAAEPVDSGWPRESLAGDDWDPAYDRRPDRVQERPSNMFLGQGPILRQHFVLAPRSPAAAERGAE